MKRRDFVNSTVSFLSLFGLSSLGAMGADALPPLTKTPSDYEGPYYPVGSREKDSNNLRIVQGSGQRPSGELLTVEGELLLADGSPVSGAVIDIWQTDPESRYKHPQDPNPGERRDDFSYWGKATTDSLGHFQFLTLVPGQYGRRPAHIHYKVWQGDSHLLTSQLYFRQRGGTRGESRSSRGDELQLADLIALAEGEFSTRMRVVI